MSANGNGFAEAAAEVRTEGRRDGGGGVQEWYDGSRYEGEFVNGLKHGRGKYSWRNGEYYEGSFYKDYRHGGGVHCWPTGHRFIGKFYLNRKEGYGQQVFPDGATFDGLYHNDRRFGPGVLNYSDGRQDVGLWLGQRLVRLCSPIDVGFGLKNFPEYAAYKDTPITNDPLTQVHTDSCCPTIKVNQFNPHWFQVYTEIDENFILPPGLESYSTDGDHLPLPPGRRRKLDQQFYGELWEPDAHPHNGYERDPLSNLPLQARVQAHILKHRLQATHVGWDVAAVLSLSREGFGPKGPLEVTSEQLIQHSSQGEVHSVSQILQTGLVHPDVADSCGNTPLIAASVNCHNEVIHLLLDMGAEIDKLNCEGMSALAVCHVLYYPFQSLTSEVITDHFSPHSSKTPNDDEVINELNEPGIPTDVKHGEMEEEEERREKERGRDCEEKRMGEEWSEGEERHVESACDQTCQHGKSEFKGEAKEFLKVEKEEILMEKDEDVEETEERKETGSEDLAFVEHSIQVLDGHISLGSVQWKEQAKQNKDKEMNPEQIFDSACSVSSYNIQVTDRVMQQSAEALSHIGNSQHCDTQGTVRKMAAIKIEHHIRLNTVKLLLERGADPNVATIPIPVLLLAIMASDIEGVRRLLLCGARTDIPLPPEKKGLFPLHVAAALPGPAGPRITEMLLHAVADPDARACDQDEIYEPDRISMMTEEALSTRGKPLHSEGGRTALHVACQRDSDYKNACKVVAILLCHRAHTDLLWSGHSPLSLAIASGNDLAVAELLKGGADPNIPLGKRVGSALCALANINYHLGGNRIKLLNMLTKAGADILMLVPVGNDVGTAVDYAHYSFHQDLHIANTPFHALSLQEREIYNAWQKLLSMMGHLLRQAAVQKEIENLEKELHLQLNTASSTERAADMEVRRTSANKNRTTDFKFCYHCGRSVAVKLMSCSRCHKVFYCSRACKRQAWDERHKDECLRVSESDGGIKKSAVLKRPKRSSALAARSKPTVDPMPLNVRLKAPVVPKSLSMAEKVLESQANLKENYSYN
ncbi:ankyrin repeat and MYND domain-containing protein 1-like [Pholidichthys leucotaenia]